MARKNLLSGLMDDVPAATTTTAPATEETKPSSSFAMRGAVGAMSRSLEKLSAQNDAAKALVDRFASSEAVIEVDASVIDASFVPDRMPGSDDDHRSLVASIAESGQLVPVLLRPHPIEANRFQTAYGHRRIRALTELGKPIRAIVKKMSDEELVIAQGKENGERRDLTFIERANYAVALENRGFKREVIGAALSVDKSEISKLISVGRAVPQKLIGAIGSAPKTGRRRWLELEALLEAQGGSTALADEILSTKRFLTADSDARFALVCAALAPRGASKPKPLNWNSEDGMKIASIDRRAGDRTTLAVNEKAAPGFGEFIVERIGSLYAEYLAKKLPGD